MLNDPTSPLNGKTVRQILAIANTALGGGTPHLAVDLTNPDIYFDQQLMLPKDVLHVVRTLFLWRGTAYQRIR